MLKNKIALVTGGSRGIGRAIVKDLASNGALVIFTYLKNEDCASSLVADVKNSGGYAKMIQSDSRDFTLTRQLIDDIVRQFGRLDILVNNAGIVKDKALMFMTPDEWKDVIETNLTGYFNMARAAIVTMMKQRKGAIINMSSVAGVIGTPRQANYSSAKAGILGLTKSLAKEVGGYNVRVNAVAPGYVDTDMTKDLKDRDRLIALIPCGRFGAAIEVAKAVTYLASDNACYVTGQVLQVDGGLAM